MDPSGHAYKYTYDGAGNLSTYQDPVMASKSQGVTYNYNTTHGLVKIQDPLGDTPIRTDYDSSGRMTDTIDAFGNKITYNYNLGANAESVTNRETSPPATCTTTTATCWRKSSPSTGRAGLQRLYLLQDGYNNKLTELLPGKPEPDGIPIRRPQ